MHLGVPDFWISLPSSLIIAIEDEDNLQSAIREDGDDYNIFPTHDSTLLKNPIPNYL